MVSQNVNHLLQQAQALSLEEREQFIELLRRQAGLGTVCGDELVASLAKRGVVLTVPPRPTADDLADFRSWKPIKMPGGDLADEIVMDRR
jgi:hypothetical protein